MIGKILKSGSSGSKVDYVTREKHDKRIFTPDTWKILGSDGLVGTKRRQIIASFESQSMLNHRISNPAGHITLSFAAEDRPKLSDKKMLQIARDYIRMMGLDKTQWLIVRHYETDKPHCHIVFNMVGNNGKRMECGRNRYKNKKVCEALTRKYGLAMPKQENPDLEKLHGIERAKAEIRIAATEALKNARDWNSFARELAKKNISIIPKYRRGTTEMQGVSFQLGDYKVKGSDVGEQFKFRNLDSLFNSQSHSRQSQPRQTQPHQASVDQSAVFSLAKSTMETLEKAAEVTADIGESICNMVGGAFQLGNGHLDENEQAAANQLLKRRRKRNNKPRLS